jgi:SAM-dependent methyltransferase
MTTSQDRSADHADRNAAVWDGMATDYVDAAERQWASDEPTWGVWNLPESACGMLPADLAGKAVIELGCGTAYVSAWAARRGAGRVVGVDVSAEQLSTARRLQEQHGLTFELHQGDAEAVPYADGSFDLVISEYGASIWCDPYAWIPEAARLLRPGGRLHFLVGTPLLMLCSGDYDGVPAEDRLVRPYFGMHRFDWPDDGSVEFHLGHGDMIDLLRDCGFEVEALVELQAPPDSPSTPSFVTAEWAHRWPSEEVWRAGKR